MSINLSRLHNLPKIDTRKLRAPKEAKKAIPCGRETAAFLACIKGDSADFAACKDLELALRQCVQGAAAARLKAPQHKSSMTFHLHKFARELGYKV